MLDPSARQLEIGVGQGRRASGNDEDWRTGDEEHVGLSIIVAAAY